MTHKNTIFGRAIAVVGTIGLLALIGFSAQRFTAALTDVNGTIYQTAFDYLANRGIVEGYPDGTGRPNGMLNRAEALAVILRSQPELIGRVVFYKQSGLPPALRFTDVDGEQWYAPYVHVAFESEITTGYPDDTFRPGQLLRVEEAIALLLRSFGETPTEQLYVVSPRVENKLGEWFTPYITLAIQKNLVMDSGGKLRLDTAITRGQFFDMLYRLLEIRSQSTGSAMVRPVAGPEVGSTVAFQAPGQMNNAEPEAFAGMFQTATPTTQTPPMNNNTREFTSGTFRNTEVGVFQGPDPEYVEPTPPPTQPTQNGTQSPPSNTSNTIGTFSLGPVPGVTFGPRETSPTPQPTEQTSPTVSAGSVPSSGVSVSVGQASSAPAYAAAADFAISMPSLGIEGLRVIHPTDLSQDGLLAPLDEGVGHLFAFPGNNDKVLIYGHSSSYWWDRSEYTRIFRRINELNPGNQVYLTYEGKVYSYEVTGNIEIPARDDPLQYAQTEGEELVLYTCWPPDSISQRYIVFARFTGVTASVDSSLSASLTSP